jgi:hypothetical protein
MQRTVFTVIGAKNSPEEPDGWTGARVEDTVLPGAGPEKALVVDGGGRSIYFLFGVPLGNLDFRFWAVQGAGQSRLTIKKIRNIDPFLRAEGCPVLEEIVIHGKVWKEYRTRLFLEDAPRLPAPSQLSPTCDGWDNKVCGLAFVLEGKQSGFAAPNLQSLSE